MLYIPIGLTQLKFFHLKDFSKIISLNTLIGYVSLILTPYQLVYYFQETLIEPYLNKSLGKLIILVWLQKIKYPHQNLFKLNTYLIGEHQLPIIYQNQW